jgi:Ca2+-transporting ATPase
MCAKGAPDVIVAKATSLATATGAAELDGSGRDRIVEENERLAAQGLRVLAVATGLVPAAAVPDGASVDDLVGLVRALEFQGLVGLTDPPRPEARDAIAACRRAGISVKMITGDHATTASAIGSSLGLEGDVVTGAELDEWSDAELSARAPGLAVFARVSPVHKVRLVNALRSRGDVVAMTGDGVNDAPALKSADIGIAMGIAGTEVTKEAATMVLTDDNFSTIVQAVHAGRTIYENVVKFVRFQLATNLGAILTILAAAVIGIPADGGALFTPIALLWVNLIMDGPPALALGVDPPTPGSMHRPPRRSDAPILSIRRLLRLLGTGAVMAVGTLGVYVAVAGGFDAPDAETEARARTMAFTTFVFFQLFNIFNARSEHTSAFTRQSFTNAKLWASLAVVAALQVLAVVWPSLQQLMTGSDVTAVLGPLDWLLVVAVAALVLVPDEARKLAAGKHPTDGFRQGRDPSTD